MYIAFLILLKLQAIFICNVTIFQTILSQELDKLRSEGEELKREKVIKFCVITWCYLMEKQL